MEGLLVFTTAPAAYDYGCNTEISANCGTYDGKPVRMIQCYDKYRRDYQAGRYQSGMYFTRMIGQTDYDIECGLFEPNDYFFNRGELCNA